MSPSLGQSHSECEDPHLDVGRGSRSSDSSRGAPVNLDSEGARLSHSVRWAKDADRGNIPKRKGAYAPFRHQPSADEISLALSGRSTFKPSVDDALEVLCWVSALHSYAIDEEPRCSLNPVLLTKLHISLDLLSCSL